MSRALSAAFGAGAELGGWVAAAEQKSGPGCVWLRGFHESQTTSDFTGSSVQSCCGHPGLSGFVSSPLTLWDPVLYPPTRASSTLRGC